MAESHGVVRLPPDSTGKRIPHTVMLEVNYSSGTIAFALGDVATFVTSGIVGTVVNVSGTTSSGELHLTVHEPVPTTPVATVGENIRVNGVTNAVAANAGYPLYVQQMTLVGDVPENILHVTNTGEALTAFAGGSPEFDAFGKTRISTEVTVQEYIQRYNELPDDFTTVITGSGSLTYNANMSGCTLSVGTVSGAKVQRTSNIYHSYRAGYSQLIQMTCALGDTGKANVVRAWGYYDDNNGIFLKQDGLNLKAVVRSKATGSVLETVIDRTAWNGDRLDGSKGVFNRSGYSLDVSKDNIWWIDMQWLGAGKVRFGVNIDGKRIVCHSSNNANNFSLPFISYPDLPIRYEIYNSGTSASTSEFNFFCATVKTEGIFTPKGTPTSVESALVAVASNVTPVFAIAARPKQTFNGIDNRALMFPVSYGIFNKGANPVIVRVVKNATIAAGTWNSAGTQSITEINTAATASGGVVIQTVIVKGGDVTRVDAVGFEQYGAGIIRLANIALYQNISLQLLCMEAAQSADVKITVDLNEVLI